MWVSFYLHSHWLKRPPIKIIARFQPPLGERVVFFWRVITRWNKRHTSVVTASSLKRFRKRLDQLRMRFSTISLYDLLFDWTFTLPPNIVYCLTFPGYPLPWALVVCYASLFPALSKWFLFLFATQRCATTQTGTDSFWTFTPHKACVSMCGPRVVCSAMQSLSWLT